MADVHSRIATNQAMGILTSLKAVEHRMRSKNFEKTIECKMFRYFILTSLLAVSMITFFVSFRSHNSKRIIHIYSLLLLINKIFK